MNPCDPLQDTHPPAANFFNPANHKDDHMVCIKQLYKQHNSGQGIQHLQGVDEAKEIFGEALCLLFAGTLLDMSYAFMDRQQGKQVLPPPFKIPSCRFVHAMIAVVHGDKDKTFLIEEFITEPFSKYVGNAQPCAIPSSNKERNHLAEFCCFLQHVQYEKSSHMAFTSDFQGFTLFYL